MAISDYPTLKFRKVLSLVQRIGYQQVRQSGSHRWLEADGRPPIVLAYHDGSDVPARALRQLLENQIGLSEPEIRTLLWGRRGHSG